MKKIVLLSFIMFLSLNTKAFAEEGSKLGFNELFTTWTGNIEETWNCPDNLDVYIPLNIWHNRLAYDDDKIDEYNEEPWGLGAGVSRFDEDGDWHGLYAMGFKDSNDHLQTIMGYAYQKNWYFGEEKDWFGGVGFTTALTQRSEAYYIPIPVPLPLAGVGYKNINIQAAYVPGVHNNGNVLFTWLRASF